MYDVYVPRIAPAIAVSLVLSTAARAGDLTTRPGECTEAAVERAARLLAELPRISPHRRGAIGSRVADALGSAASDSACWARAFERAHALLGGAPAPRPLDPGAALDQAKQSATLARLRAVRVALLSYQAEYDKLPSTEEGIGSMVASGMLRREDILDAWGRVLIYRRARSDPRELTGSVAGSAPPGLRPSPAGSGLEFELTSAGPDGTPHTTDDVSLPYF